MGELCTVGSSEIGPRGRIGGNRKGGWRTVEYKVQTEVNFWIYFEEESCELLAVDGCIPMFDGID